MPLYKRGYTVHHPFGGMPFSKVSHSKAYCWADGTCRRLNELANKTDTPGRFTFYSQKWNNDNDMRIVEVLYDEYALVYTNKTKDGVSEVLNNLYSRTQEPSVAWQQRFTQFSLDTGILPENIVILPKNGMLLISKNMHFVKNALQLFLFRSLLMDILIICCYSGVSRGLRCTRPTSNS
uniref:Lipocalin/cytosolic fatty-acid binding domain-containing protein n=1 Tax=Monopterus albus TaxID=43700 RepID=A0A3Q3JS58_MONAL